MCRMRGCGPGRARLWLAERFPLAGLWDAYPRTEIIEQSPLLVEKPEHANLRLVAKDACLYLITAFDAVHDQGTPRAVLKGIYCALKPGGICLVPAIHGTSCPENNPEHPPATLRYSVPTLQGVTDSTVPGGGGLGTL